MGDEQLDDSEAEMSPGTKGELSTQVSAPHLSFALSPAISAILASFTRHRVGYLSTARQLASSRLSQIVEVRDTPVGRGVFARDIFLPGAMIATIAGKLVTDAHHASEYCMDFNETESLDPDPPFRFLNHSCEPNCELVVLEADETHEEEMALFARRDVGLDDELTIDYGWTADHAIPCLCGERLCRGWIVCPEELALCGG